TSADYDRTRTVPQLVADIAKETPDALAVACGPTHLSYRELDGKANQLARYLQRLDVGPEAVVGIFTPPSTEMVIAWLAVLRAGGAYVPIDPQIPDARLRFLIGDAGCKVLLTTQDLRSCLTGISIPVLSLDTEWGKVAAELDTAPVTSAGPENMAYVIYTSGSTGVPKGVEVEHRSLLNLIHWHRSRYDVCPADRATQLANPAFDASVWELWPYLTAGASLP